MCLHHNIFNIHFSYYNIFFLIFHDELRSLCYNALEISYRKERFFIL